MKSYPFFVLATLALACTTHAGPRHKHESGLVVHEWGTFTSMQGQDGVSIEGLYHEEEALPEFVHNLRNGGEPRVQATKIGTRTQYVTQKMETPVIYFYTKKRMKASVYVSYDKGVVSEWFPNAKSHLIHRRAGRRGDPTKNMSLVENSHIAWDVELIPRGHAEPSGIPGVAAKDPWAFARDVDAAYVKTPQGEAEHYIFYRGLSSQRLPVRVQVGAGGRASVTNDSAHDLPAAFLLENGPAGARWSKVGRVRAGRTRRGRLDSKKLESSRQAVADLREAVKKSLVASGLFEKEAEGMVRTWSRSWFASEGTRLIYVVPREITDQMLHLGITPSPDKLVRVLIGRVEYITPETARDVSKAIANRFSKSGVERSLAAARLVRLGRFLEPHVRNALKGSPSGQVKRNAQRILATIARQAGGGH